MACVAVRVVTAFGAEELITGTAGYLSQWAGEDLRHAGAGFAGFATLAVRVVAAFRADQLVVDAAGDSIGTDDGVGLACAVDAVGATFAIRVVTALRADQLIIDAAGDPTSLAEDDVRFTETVDAGGAIATIARFATLVAIDAFDGRVRRRAGDTAELAFRTNSNARVYTHVTDFARVVTQQWFARAGGAAARAGIAVFVPAACLANAGAAEQAGRTVGGAGAAIGWVFLEVDAFAVTAGEAIGTITGHTCATEPSGYADAVTTPLGLGIATSGAAGDTSRCAGALRVALRAFGAVRCATALRAVRRSDGGRAADFFTFAGGNALAADAGFARIADDRLADASHARRTDIAVRQAGAAE